MKTKYSDFTNICRTCLKIVTSLDKISIYDCIELENECFSTIVERDKQINIWDIISLFLSEIHGIDQNELPTQICIGCSHKLREFYKFHLQIEKSDRILRKIQTTPKVTTPMTIDIENPIKNIPIDNYEVDQVEKRFNEEIFDITDTQTYTCIVCQKTFISDSRLQIHLVRKHSVRCDQNVGKEYKCDKCDKSYTTRANLHIHERVHSGPKSFECIECGRAFYNQNGLISHMSIHTGQKNYKCVDCGKCFTTANILQQHRKKHSSLKPHKCSKCPQAFHTQNELRIHFRMHTGEQPHLCCQCGKRFTRKTHLNIHLRTHTGIKPFKCHFEMCEKSFALSGDLTAHIRIHTGEKPYQCYVCEKSFNQSSARNIHMRVHTGKRNYICQICNAAFTQSASLKRHVKVHIHSDCMEKSDDENLLQNHESFH